MTLNDLISELLRCQMMTSRKIGKRKEKRNIERERFSNRISKTQTFTDLYNYLTSSAVFYILLIQNKWLKCKKWHKCESVPLRIHYLFKYPETPAFKAGTT